MKKCMKKNSNTFIIKVLLTIIYFILFTLCITFTMYALTWCLEDGESFFPSYPIYRIINGRYDFTYSTSINLGIML